MLGILDKEQPSRRAVLVMLSPRLLSKRSSLLLLAFSVFIGGLLVASSRLGELCHDGSLCGLSSLRRKLSPAGHEAVAPTSQGPRQGSAKEADECAHFPDTSKVLLVMKTGASEAYGKVPNQIMTNLKCLPDLLVFGDMEQRVAGHKVHDSLESVLAQVKEENSDFELYFRQKTCPVDQEACNKNHKVGEEAWKLDKYKNIHMAEKTYAMRRHYDWYLFVDADTYVVWPTLMQWLERLDAADRHYIGSVAYVGNFPFGHGGSGYLVSQATMRTMFDGQANVANRWDQRVTRECCGDYVFSLALHNETGIDVENAWPTINGEKPNTLPYAHDEWCQPIATMHHVGAQDVSDLWGFEVERRFAGPMRIKDVFHRFVEDKLEPSRAHWDNLSDSVFYLNRTARQYSDHELKRAKWQDLSALELAAHRSFDDCRRACQSIDRCFQYRFHNSICAISYTIKHGRPAEPQDDHQLHHHSGWIVKRIKQWVQDHDKCGDVEFPFNTRWFAS
ncbi:hypothetical protein CDD81_6145 [Ophiocordyceps australis]|uniref:Apple domain-containing protein n=1 Tax=Ophiocordyceps australis TaxID=1399860 RepID=A0A2C5XHY5_9HYPO|nr:hypothetical protein CDD81_6145 [Ophiocordyceps australis]